MSKANGNGKMVGGLRSLFNGKEDGHESRAKAVEALQKDFPLVAEALSGSPAGPGIEEIPPGTITFWIDGQVMKFTYSVKSLQVSHYGTVSDVANPWGSVNSALLLGEVSRKRHSELSSTAASLEKQGKLY